MGRGATAPLPISAVRAAAAAADGLDPAHLARPDFVALSHKLDLREE